MQYLPDAKQMKAADQYTIEGKGVPSLSLMEQAAAAFVRALQAQAVDPGNTLVVCGSGNNGGDGLAIARLLSEAGSTVTVLTAGAADHRTEETKTEMERLSKTEVRFLSAWQDDAYTLVVDALFGVGLSRDVEGTYAALIQAMNDSSGFKAAVDIPSGISADTGCVLGCAFRADLTVTFQAVKRGLVLYPGQTYAGQIYPVDIGVDTSAFATDPSVCYAISDARALLPERPEDSHKGTFGKLLVIAGSRGMCGAAYLNAYAAYLCGAGLVQIYTTEDNRPILQELLPEAILTTYTTFDERTLIHLLSWADAVCVGSGIGQGTEAVSIMETVLTHSTVPTLVDADGLNVLASHRYLFEKKQHAAYIFTPHMKEMSRLTGQDVAAIRKDRFSLTEAFVKQAHATLVLKDARTLIQPEDGRACLNLNGNAAMAKGGSGDVLSGIIAGLLAQGVPIPDAAVLGTYLHGESGDLAREEKGAYSVLARDLITKLPDVFLKEESRS